MVRHHRTCIELLVVIGGLVFHGVRGFDRGGHAFAGDRRWFDGSGTVLCDIWAAGVAGAGGCGPDGVVRTKHVGGILRYLLR